MEIKIKAVDMIEVLVEAGIEPVDAKALTLDLLMTASGETPRTRLKKVAQERKLRVKQAVEDTDVEEDDEYEEEEDEYEEPPKKTRVRRVRKKMDFSAFGGKGVNLGDL